MQAAEIIPAEAIYRSYVTLSSVLAGELKPDLGGLLLYAGEINLYGSTLLYAANVAGAASIAASADPATQRQALKDGAIDFLVNSLEEALRILKNEIRKQNPVSVGVAVAPHALVAAMLDRGVLPDLLPPVAQELFGSQQEQVEIFVRQGAHQLSDAQRAQGRRDVEPDETRDVTRYVSWSADREFTRWLPQIDKLAQSILPAEDNWRQRWLRLAPRYLGRSSQREHGIGLSSFEAGRLKDRVKEMAGLNHGLNEERAAIFFDGERIS